ASRVFRQRLLLARPQLVDRPVEDDERQDVGLVEAARRAAQRQLRRPRRAGDVDARGAAVVGDQPLGGDVERGVDLRTAAELRRAVTQQREAAALELVE